MLNEVITFLTAHKSEILTGFVVPFVIFTVSKFPDPRTFEGKWYFAPYFAFFTIATYYSSGDWTEWGGKLTLPFQQYPKLDKVPHPFKVPEYFK